MYKISRQIKEILTKDTLRSLHGTHMDDLSWCLLACSELLSFMVIQKAFYVSESQKSILLASPICRPTSYQVLELTYESDLVIPMGLFQLGMLYDCMTL